MKLEEAMQEHRLEMIELLSIFKSSASSIKKAANRMGACAEKALKDSGEIKAKQISLEEDKDCNNKALNDKINGNKF